MTKRTLPVPSSRVEYAEGSDPREVAAEWIGDAVRGWRGRSEDAPATQADVLIGVAFALLALVDELRART